MLSSELRTYLLSIPEISSKIGTRLYPGWLPEKPTFPAVAYLEISGVAHHDIGVAFPRYQFSVFAPRYSDAQEVANEIRDALQRYKGNMSGVRIIQGVWEGSREMYEDETQLYHIATDFRMIYREVD